MGVEEWRRLFQPEVYVTDFWSDYTVLLEANRRHLLWTVVVTAEPKRLASRPPIDGNG